MEIIQTTALITINDTLWVQIIVFLVFLFLINRVMFRPVRRNLAEREAHFEALRKDIAILDQETRALISATEEEESRLIAAARATADQRLRESRREARQMMEGVLEEIKALRQKSEEEIRSSLAAARKEIGAAADDLTRRIIDHLVRVEGPA